MFHAQKDRRAITALLRKFAIREDREELGNNTGPRFKSELINPRKGTPTSYIAKYISKNIDGRGLAGEISKETGKSLRDNAEYVNAGRLCIVFSNSASLVFRGVRLTVNFACWLVRRQGNRVTKKQVRRYWITRVLMPFWLLLMLVVLPPTS